MSMLIRVSESATAICRIQPVLGGFSVAGMHKKYGVAYHPGALKYFQDKQIEARALDEL